MAKWPLLAAEQGIPVGLRSIDPGIVENALCGGRTLSKRARELSLATRQDTQVQSRRMFSGFIQVRLVREGAVKSWQVRFPLLLHKALNWGQQAWIWLHKLDPFE